MENFWFNALRVAILGDSASRIVRNFVTYVLSQSANVLSHYDTIKLKK
jgi:hypothetical protein